MADIREDFQQLLQNYPCSDFQSDEKNYENAIIKKGENKRRACWCVELLYSDGRCLWLGHGWNCAGENQEK